jgi:hypothetical protein
MTSLDDYIADADGNFGWQRRTPPCTPCQRPEAPGGTHLCDRRLHEVTSYGDTSDSEDGEAPPFEQDFARIWQAADKVVYSRTLRRCRPPGRAWSGSSTRRRSAP